MRTLLFMSVLSAALAGCATPADRQTDSASSESTRPQKAKAASMGRTAARSAASLSITNKNQVITLTEPMEGKVAAVNPGLRFVVLDFSLNRMPAIEERMMIYRQGNKVGEVRVTGPERNGTIVADIVRGEAQVGDEARWE